jgi:hypothetical protein
MSQYQYKQFSETLGAKSDPMLAGLDLSTLRPIEEVIAEKKERLELPADYDVHRSIQLLPQRWVGGRVTSDCCILS